MTAPATTSRQTPSGIPLHEGYPIKIALKLDPDFSLREKEVKPPAYDGGDPIDISTQHNTFYETKYPRSLINIGAITGRGSYDPEVFTQSANIINVNRDITLELPDGSTLDLFGWFRLFDPQPMSASGGQPEANFTIEVSNYDPVNFSEQGPVLTSVSGT